MPEVQGYGFLIQTRRETRSVRDVVDTRIRLSLIQLKPKRQTIRFSPTWCHVCEQDKKDQDRGGYHRIFLVFGFQTAIAEQSQKAAQSPNCFLVISIC